MPKLKSMEIVNNRRKIAIVQVFDTPEFIKSADHLKNEKDEKVNLWNVIPYPSRNWNFWV